MYCKANQIVISYEKCCYIEFKRPLNAPKLKLSFLGKEVKPEKKCKFLGIFINENLDWSDQISNARKLASQAIGALNSIKSCVPQKILRSVYFALVQPYFIYTMPLWASNHSSNDFEALFRLQKRALRIITNNTKKVEGIFQHTKPLFQKTYILTVHNLYFYFSACEAFKVLSSKKPATIFNFFDISSRSSRLILPKFNKEKYKSNSFIFNSSKIINLLAANNIDYNGLSLQRFKTLVKRFLMNRQNKHINNDPNWLPINYSIFSDVAL